MTLCYLIDLYNGRFSRHFPPKQKQWQHETTPHITSRVVIEQFSTVDSPLVNLSARLSQGGEKVVTWLLQPSYNLVDRITGSGLSEINCTLMCVCTAQCVVSYCEPGLTLSMLPLCVIKPVLETTSINNDLSIKDTLHPKDCKFHELVKN